MAKLSERLMDFEQRHARRQRSATCTITTQTATSVTMFDDYVRRA